MRLGQPVLPKLEVHHSVSLGMREGKERAAMLTPAAPNSGYCRPVFACQRMG